jgi:hypothetical protein
MGSGELGRNIMAIIWRLKSMRFTIALSFLLVGNIAIAQVPNVFQSGTPASAAEVNQNFADVVSRTDQNAGDVAILGQNGVATDAVVDTLYATIGIEAVFGTDLGDGSAEAFCPTDTVAVGANCGCVGGGDGVSNYGVLAACFTFVTSPTDPTQGAFGVCYEDFTYDAALEFAFPFVEAICMDATLVNGDPGLSYAMSAANPSTGLSKSTLGGSDANSRQRARDAVSARRSALIGN